MKKTLAVLFASAALLAACGGGDDAAPAPTPSPAPPPVALVPPLSINDSVANFIGYVLALVTITDSTIEPLDISAVVPPVSDTTEPTPLP